MARIAVVLVGMMVVPGFSSLLASGPPKLALTEQEQKILDAAEQGA